MQRRRRSSGSSGIGIRLLIGLAFAAFSVISYLGSQEYNPVTGDNQYISMTPNQEIALGLQSAPQMIEEFGGVLQDREAQDALDRIGNRLVNSSIARDTPWRFEFTILDDRNTVNAFALPGGPTFITTALLAQLDNEDQVAGVMAHEIVHVLARHSAERIAQSELTNGLVGAVGVASGEASAAQTAQMVAQFVTMSYGREAELESDTIGVCLMIAAGYDPNEMKEVMRVLEAASGGSRQPEFASTHPSPDNRIQKIDEAIQNASQNCPRVSVAPR
ncbi:MAG: M48 family metalloprotease [Aggregatilineales bacterium]